MGEYEMDDALVELRHVLEYVYGSAESMLWLLGSSPRIGGTYVRSTYTGRGQWGGRLDVLSWKLLVREVELMKARVDTVEG